MTDPETLRQREIFALRRWWISRIVCVVWMAMLTLASLGLVWLLVHH